MITLNAIAEYMSIALHFMVWTLFICGLFIWTQRHDNKKQRNILALTLFLAAVMMFLRLIITYDKGIPISYSVLPIQNLYGGYWALVLMFLYPVEAVNPGWLKWRTVFIIFLPMIAITIILAIFPFEFRELYSLNDIVTYISETNVWFRLVILLVFIVPYTILLLCVPYNWKKSGVDAKWIRIYAIGLQGVGVLYISFMLTGSIAVSAIHLTYCTLFFLYITYQELFLRLLPHSTKKAINVVEETTVASSNKEKQDVCINGLWERLEVYMNTENPWRSPNITIGDVAKAIGSNRTTLSAELTLQGVATFYDLVAEYRIKAFCDMAKEGEIENINEALFSVGFRSRSTAYERFKKQMDMTPAEYVRNIRNNSL